MFLFLQTADAADEKVAKFFYANKISFSSVGSKLFVELVKALRIELFAGVVVVRRSSPCTCWV